MSIFANSYFTFYIWSTRE